MAAGHRKGDVFLRVEETVTYIERKTVVSGVPEDTGGDTSPTDIRRDVSAVEEDS